MRIITFITDYSAADKIIAYLKLTFGAERPPPPQVAQYELMMAAEYLNNSPITIRRWV